MRGICGKTLDIAYSNLLYSVPMQYTFSAPSAFRRVIDANIRPGDSRSRTIYTLLLEACGARSRKTFRKVRDSRPPRDRC